MKFVEDSFQSKVELIESDYMKSLIDKSVDREITSAINFNDMDMNLFILSPKNYVDIVSKDFAKSYHHTLKIYQNDMGHFDKSKQLFKSSNEHWVFLKYNNIVEVDNKYHLKTVVRPIPIPFKSSYDLHERLQKSFNIVKSATLQQIYRNNYAKHCINKVVVDGEEKVENREGETDINLCIILLEHEKDVYNIKLA